MADIPARLRLRAGTLAAWTSANPVLASGEPGYEIDTKVFRIGDGSSPFLSLQRFTTSEGLAAIFQQSNVNLTALSGLTFAANKGIYLTGANTAALFNLSAQGRALLDDPDAASQRVTLGLGAAAILGVSADANFSNAQTSLATRATTKTFVDNEIAAQRPDWTELAPVATTSGSAIDLIGFPSGLEEIQIQLANVRHSTADSLLIQLFVGGSVVTSGWVASSTVGSGNVQSTAGVPIFRNSTTNEITGVVRFERSAGNVWFSSGVASIIPPGGATVQHGRVVLAGDVTGIRLTTIGGGAAFNLGSAVVRYR